jgi:hypothetical protein
MVRPELPEECIARSAKTRPWLEGEASRGSAQAHSGFTDGEAEGTRQGKAQSHDLIFPAKNGGVQGHLLRILRNFVEDNASKASGNSINSGRHSRRYITSRASVFGRCSIGSATLIWKPRWPISKRVRLPATTLKLRSIRRSKRLRRLSPTQATMRMIRNVVQPALDYDPCDRNHSSSVVNTL